MRANVVDVPASSRLIVERPGNLVGAFAGLPPERATMQSTVDERIISPLNVEDRVRKLQERASTYGIEQLETLLTETRADDFVDQSFSDWSK